MCVKFTELESLYLYFWIMLSENVMGLYCLCVGDLYHCSGQITIKCFGKTSFPLKSRGGFREQEIPEPFAFGQIPF